MLTFAGERGSDDSSYEVDDISVRELVPSAHEWDFGPGAVATVGRRRGPEDVCPDTASQQLADA